MRKIYKLFPTFFVIWFARRYCEIHQVHGRAWALAFDDVLVRVEKKKGNKRRIISYQSAD
jgi:hypothetical protein